METNIKEKLRAAENDPIERKEDLKEAPFPRKRGWVNLRGKLAVNVGVTRRLDC